MKKISSNIAYLLLSQHKVEISGLGTFMLEPIAASFNEADSSFTISKNKILFIQNPEINSDILPLSIARKLKIELPDARNLVQEFVDTILTSLSNHRYCKLPSLGYLILDLSNHIIFTDTFSI